MCQSLKIAIHKSRSTHQELPDHPQSKEKNTITMSSSIIGPLTYKVSISPLCVSIDVINIIPFFQIGYM